MGGGDFNVFACLALPMTGKCLIELGIEFPGRGLADIQELNRSLDCAQGECAEKDQRESMCLFGIHR